MAKALCKVNNQSTINGVNVEPGTTVNINLNDLSGVSSWKLECIYTDESHNKTDITQSLVVNNTLKQATFVAPDDPSALIFRSTINRGVDGNGERMPEYVATFGVYVPAGTGRLVAAGETTEGNAEFGWVGSALNPSIKGAQAVSGSFLFKPGAPSVGNQFASWTALWSAVMSTTGAVTILVDSSVSSAVVPSGTYDFQNRITLSGMLNGESVLQFDESVIVENLTNVTGSLTLESTAKESPPPIKLRKTLFVDQGSTLRAAYNVPLIFIDNKDATIALAHDSKISNESGEDLKNVVQLASDTEVEDYISTNIILYSRSNIQAKTFVSYSENYDREVIAMISDDSHADYSQSGNILITVNNSSKSEQIRYTEDNTNTNSPSLNATTVYRAIESLRDLTSGTYVAEVSGSTSISPLLYSKIAITNSSQISSTAIITIDTIGNYKNNRSIEIENKLLNTNAGRIADECEQVLYIRPSNDTSQRWYVPPGGSIVVESTADNSTFKLVSSSEVEMSIRVSKNGSVGTTNTLITTLPRCFRLCRAEIINSVAHSGGTLTVALGTTSGGSEIITPQSIGSLYTIIGDETSQLGTAMSSSRKYEAYFSSETSIYLQRTIATSAISNGYLIVRLSGYSIYPTQRFM